MASEAMQLAALGTAKVPRQSPQPQSKRDKKRQLLNDRLASLADQTSRDKDRQYREELSKIQVDVNLVSRVDPYADRPLDEIDRERRERELSQATNGAGSTSTHRSLLEMAGPSFQEWIHEVEDLVETRDYDMTSQKYEYERKMQGYHNTHAYRIEVAKREHKILSETLKDRLINNLISKKYRLNKEKEAIDISDGSSLHLHPNAFSLTNPSSPGGPHGKRNTRLRREMEEIPNFSDGKKRKRNAADDDGSPAPQRIRGDTSNSTAFWQSDRLKSMHRDAGPVYSLDKLFTDKELSMTYNAAALAAHKHLLSRRDANGNILPTPDESETSNGDANEDEDLSAVAMERQPSHATRSTRGVQNQQNFYDDKVLGVEGLASFELPGNLSRLAAQEPKLPPLVQSQYVKAYVKSESNTPTSLSLEDAQQDLAIIGLWKSYQSNHGLGSNIEIENGGRRLLEIMSVPQRRNQMASYIQGARPSVEALAEDLGVPSYSSLRDEPVASSLAPMNAASNSSAGVPMSRQSSLGGVSMSRTGSGRGKRKN